MAHASRKMLIFLAFCALVATSQSLILSMADNQSLEDSVDSGSESVESSDSAFTLFPVHRVKKPSYGPAGSGGRPATPGADAEGLAPRFGGGGDTLTSAPGNSSGPTTEIPSTASELAQTVTKDRSKSPIFNIWEFAKIAGPVHVRTGGGPNDFQQTSTSGLNRCEWAIISCCQSPSRSRRNSCFAALHCGGAWFENPCADHLQMAVYGKLLEVGSF